MVEPEDPSDFVNEMYAALVEEASLWELPGGTTDLLSNGPVTHGPWQPAECAGLIIRWVERGWVELYLPELPAQWDLQRSEWEPRAERRGELLILTRADSLDLLHDPNRWIVSSLDGHASLVKTDLGMTIGTNDWFALGEPVNGR